MAKRRIFASFDYDNDLDLKNALIGQARLPDSPFEVIDFSLKESQPESEWERKARDAIKRAETVIILLGSRTHSASGVKKEVRFATDEGKHRFQLKPQDKNPQSVLGGGVVYNWTWDNLRKLLA